MTYDEDQIEVFRDLVRAPAGEVWYGVKYRGRDLQAIWADPEAARSYASREYDRGPTEPRGAEIMTETETPEAPAAEPETEPTETPEAEPETENGDDPED